MGFDRSDLGPLDVDARVHQGVVAGCVLGLCHKLVERHVRICGEMRLQRDREAQEATSELQQVVVEASTPGWLVGGAAVLRPAIFQLSALRNYPPGGCSWLRRSPS